MKELKNGCNALFPIDHRRKMVVDYDKEADVLYISYVSQKADDATQIGDYILRFFKNRLIGVTVINALEHVKVNFTDAPNIFSDEKLIYA